MRWTFLLVSMALAGCARSAPLRATPEPPAPLRATLFAITPDQTLDAPLSQAQPTHEFDTFDAELPTGFVFRPADGPQLTQWFRARFVGTFQVVSPGRHLFYVTSDDGARVTIDGQLVVDNGAGFHVLTVAVGAVELGEGKHTIAIDYLQGPELMGLSLQCVRPNGEGDVFDTRRAW